MKLFDMAHVLRSKNSGPFAVTLDILFDDREKYERVKKSGKITPASIAALCDQSNFDTKEYGQCL